MLSYRKDVGTGNKLELYWNDGRGKVAVKPEERDHYWLKEVARLKAVIVGNEKEHDAIIKCADAIINHSRGNT